MTDFDLKAMLYGSDQHVAENAGYADAPPRMGFFTDTSICIGCKACEVACKEWNAVPEDGLNFTGMSYDNTQGLGADSWRHVAFIEKPARPAVDLGLPTIGPPTPAAVATDPGSGKIDLLAAPQKPGFQWLM